MHHNTALTHLSTPLPCISPPLIVFIVSQTELNKETLESVVMNVLSTHSSQKDLYWPSEDDVLAAFEVFDQEGLGYIPVQQLKRFLLQAQLGFRDEKECELPGPGSKEDKVNEETRV